VPLDAAQEERIDRTATRDRRHQDQHPPGGVEDMLREFALSTRRGWR
jgi:hypothetical protein